MCKYCEFELMQEPFTEEEVWRGDLFLHEKDSDMYLERKHIVMGSKSYYFYNILTQLSNRKKIEQEINFCPNCGRELPKIR